MAKLVLRLFVIFIAFCALSVAVPMLMSWEATHAVERPLFLERSWLEMKQSALLLLAQISLVMHFVLRREKSGVLAVMIALVLLCFQIRELDYWLDRYVFDGAWQTLVTITVLGLFAFWWKWRGAFAEQLDSFQRHSAFGMLLAGVLTIAFSRMFGVGDFWELVMGDQYMRSVKNAAEEGTETFAYVLILCATLLWWLQPQNRTEKINEPD